MKKLFQTIAIDIAIDVIESEYKILMLYDDVHPDANTIGKSLESDINIDFEIISLAQENIQLSGFDLIIFSGIKI